MKQQKETICYLVRHGHPQLPDGRKYYLGRTDLSLSPQGLPRPNGWSSFLRSSLLRPFITVHCAVAAKQRKLSADKEFPADR